MVFVENNDSFSWNVIDLLPVPAQQVLVVHGGTQAAEQAIEAADAVVLGPGPKDPHRAGLVALAQRAISQQKPLLGICLGHQAIGLAFGAAVERTTPAHGKTGVATFSDSRLFPGMAGAHTVMRYHSLSLTGVSSPLSVVARLADGTVMAVEHQALPVAGLQFHPDSHGTPQGRRLVEAFFGALR